MNFPGREVDEREREADDVQWEYECQLERERVEMFMMLGRRNRQKQGSSSGTTRKTVRRNKEEGHIRLMQDYFNPNPTYDDRFFRRRYRMPISLFNRILTDVVQHDSYFEMGKDAVGRDSLSPQQKLTSSFRMLAYGCLADSVDEYCRMAESTVLKCLRIICKAIINIYGSHYLREPNVEDLSRILHHSAGRDFPGLVGSIDCMHWEWKNCPTAWSGQYTGYKRKPIVLEAVASYNTWIWHAFFGTPGSNNDINTLGVSPLFDRAVNGFLPKVRYEVNGNIYEQCYYLADGIYPQWATFVKTITNPNNPKKKKLFAQLQEAYRKDVERAFGILQERWAIVRGPSRLWDVQTMGKIMLTCIILHNMIVEDQRFEEPAARVEYETNPDVKFSSLD